LMMAIGPRQLSTGLVFQPNQAELFAMRAECWPPRYAGDQLQLN
jgi:hypothetical protein